MLAVDGGGAEESELLLEESDDFVDSNILQARMDVVLVGPKM